ncbi:MAG: hypothetical protein JXB06_10460 [Spirochaetales bacterium]|nr:hypothetical protein [Spirochaetales bacterium]
MKAFLIILVILVILAGVAFYFGWVQIKLPAENYAVVFTKTGGYDQQVIPPGEFTWRWERLIPTNMTLYVFDLHPRKRDISFQGSLPSAELYSSVLPESPDFSLRGTVSVEFAVSPESLPALVAEQKLRPEDLDDFYSARAEEISDRVVETLKQIDAQAVDSLTLSRRLEEELASEFTDLQLRALKVDLLEVPDLRLYELARSSYQDLVEVRDRSRNEAVARLAEEQVRAENARDQERASLEALREYGKLLEEYPVLLKAMAVQKLSGDQVITIPEFDLESILE